MRVIKIIFILTLLIIFSRQTALACRCYTSPPPCYSYGKFDAVFVGTVKSVEEQTPENGFVPKVEIDVEQNFKGIKGKKAFTDNPNHSCAWRFKEGDKFLFYGTFGEKGDYFGTGLCTRTARYDEKLSDFEFFNALNSSTPNYWVWGTFSNRDGESGVAGIRAEVLDGKKFLPGMSDKNGNLKIAVSKEGKYKVRVYIPKKLDFIPSYDVEDQRYLIKSSGKNKKGVYVEYEVEVKNNQCGWIDARFLRFGK